jgi:hypothetical protein
VAVRRRTVYSAGLVASTVMSAELVQRYRDGGGGDKPVAGGIGPHYRELCDLYAREVLPNR